MGAAHYGCRIFKVRRRIDWNPHINVRRFSDSKHIWPDPRIPHLGIWNRNYLEKKLVPDVLRTGFGVASPIKGGGARRGKGREGGEIVFNQKKKGLNGRGILTSLAIVNIHLSSHRFYYRSPAAECHQTRSTNFDPAVVVGNKWIIINSIDWWMWRYWARSFLLWPARWLGYWVGSLRIKNFWCVPA